MRAAWVATALMGGLVACGFYDSVPRPSDPFGGNVGIPDLPDGGLPDLPDGGDVTYGDGGSNRDGGTHLPGGDGGFDLPDGGFGLPDGGTLPDGGSDGGSGLPDAGCEGAACAPEVIAVSGAQPMGLALSATHVYWADVRAPSVRRVPKAGGPVETVFAPSMGENMRAPVVVDAERVYFATSSSFGGSLYGLPLLGGASARWGLGDVRVNELGQNGTWLFMETEEHGLQRVAKAENGWRTILLPATGHRFAADTGGVYFAEDWGRQLEHVTVEGQRSVVADLPQGMRAVALSTAANIHAVALQPVAADPRTCAGSVLTVRGRGGSELVGVAESPGCVASLTADATHLYWLALVPGRGTLVLRAPVLEGAGAERVAEASGDGWSLAVDESHVYWSEQSSGRILRMPKPR